MTKYLTEISKYKIIFPETYIMIISADLN